MILACKNRLSFVSHLCPLKNGTYLGLTWKALGTYVEGICLCVRIDSWVHLSECTQFSVSSLRFLRNIVLRYAWVFYILDAPPHYYHRPTIALPSHCITRAFVDDGNAIVIRCWMFGQLYFLRNVTRCYAKKCITALFVTIWQIKHYCTVCNDLTNMPTRSDIKYNTKYL